VLERGGDVIVFGADLVQDDTWTYQASAGSAQSFIRWSDITKPVFADAGQLDQSLMELECSPSGDPITIYTVIRPQGRLALLSRVPRSLAGHPHLRQLSS